MPNDSPTKGTANVGVTPIVRIRTMSGLEFLSGIASGALPGPPIAETQGFHLDEVAEGRAVFAGTPGRRHYNPIGSVHGGYAATLPAGRGYTTLEFKINLVRPLSDKTGPVRAIGTAIQVGARIGTAEGRIVDAEGRLYAHGMTTCLIFDI